jgi:hypothetical protein
MRPLVVIATMHGKERVLGPVLVGLGMDWLLSDGLDTDSFGTFTGDVARPGSQLDAARLKAEAALKLNRRARYALSSEGSFGPHPQVPLVPGGVELVYLLDRVTGLAVKGWHITAKTNYAQQVVESWSEAQRFAERIGFPSHAMVLGAAANPEGLIAKGVVAPDRFERLTRQALASFGLVALSADMRAHLNPTRMAAIEQAAQDLRAAWISRCPACAAPGFVVRARPRGLPCRDCGAPTNEVSAEVQTCDGCGHKEVHNLPGQGDPQWCPQCNP